MTRSKVKQPIPGKIYEVAWKFNPAGNVYLWSYSGSNEPIRTAIPAMSLIIFIRERKDVLSYYVGFKDKFGYIPNLVELFEPCE
jgi:hypothetical protein